MDKVYAAWTNPALLRQWFAPDDMTASNAEAEAREGGRYLIHMHDGEAGTDL